MAGQDPATPLREIPLVKTILLSIVTLGIYSLVWSYRNSQDIQTARADGFGFWKIMFILGFFTFGVTFLVLYILNFIQVGKMRAEAGGDNTMGIIALILTFLTGIVGAILWAVHWNNTVQTLTGTGEATASTGASTA